MKKPVVKTTGFIFISIYKTILIQHQVVFRNWLATCS